MLIITFWPYQHKIAGSLAKVYGSNVLRAQSMFEPSDTPQPSVTHNIYTSLKVSNKVINILSKSFAEII